VTTSSSITQIHGAGVSGIPEVREGDDLGALISDRLRAGGCPLGDLTDGDVVVVTSKVVSKSEGKRVPASLRDEAIASETVRVVAQRGHTRIVETRHGLVLAAAGIDASNVEEGWVLLLPEDPDRSARRIRHTLSARWGVRLAVVITDTAGRPWRNGLVDIAIGAAGLRILNDHRGRRDIHGNELRLTVTAIADEIAALAELVKGKVSQLPVAVVRGLGEHVMAGDGPGARALVRPPDEDLFRNGVVDDVLTVPPPR
jgi:coenzyme F420-0:L-glutamate ligase/coenzyme F420-1:gamma-L-glutamate ligase